MKTYTLTILLTFIAQLSFGQKELFGTWKVTCPTKQIDKATIEFCGLCPNTIINGNSFEIDNFEITFDETGMKFSTDDTGYAIRYEWTRDFSILRFQHKEINYKFNLIKSGRVDILILQQEETDLQLVLKRI